VRRSVIFAAAVALFGSLLSAPSALSATVGQVGGGLAAPALTAVVVGEVDGQVRLDYVPLADSSVTGYQYSLNAGIAWMPCLDSVGSCTIVGLPNGQPVTLWLRAVNDAGGGAVTTATATPSSPAAARPVLPRPRQWATATFNAAGNGLGVNGAKTPLGVGTLPQLRFSRPITDKAAVEKGLRVTATSKQGLERRVRGAWGWIDDRTVVFRPERWWPAHSTITITSTLGRQVLGRGANNKYVIGRSNLDAVHTFRTGRKFIAVVDGAKKNMVVRIDGKVRKKFPVSLGKSGWETRNGPKIISTSKEAFKVYTSQAIGITDPAQAYRLEAPWNTRLTPTGEFIHAAPWAYGRLGRANGSHGCTNMYAADAKWIYDQTRPGDVIDFVNTGGSMVESWNGPGGWWNIPWESWLKKSALGSPSGLPDTSKDPGSVQTAPPVGA
jgi:lipoprotein-anchoring transpeptidase ErfK/SrfK